MRLIDGQWCVFVGRLRGRVRLNHTPLNSPPSVTPSWISIHPPPSDPKHLPPGRLHPSLCVRPHFFHSQHLRSERTGWAILRSPSLPTNPPTHESHHDSTNLPIYQSTNKATNEPSNQPIHQPANQQTNHSTNPLHHSHEATSPSTNPPHLPHPTPSTHPPIRRSTNQ